MQDWNRDNPLTALLNGVTAISSKLEAQQVAEEAARQFIKFLNAEACSISAWDKQANTVNLWAACWRGRADFPQEWQRPFRLSEYPLSLKVLQTKEPAVVHTGDPQADPSERDLLEKANLGCVLLLPLMYQDQVTGLIEVYDVNPQREFLQPEIALGQLLANHVGISIERAHLLSDAKQHAAEMEALREASLELGASLDLQTVFTAILKSTLELIKDALDAHIFLYDGERLDFGAALWADGQQGKVWSEPREHGLTYTVARGGKAVVVPDMSSHPLYAGTPLNTSGSIVGLPLKIGSRVVGVMNVAYKSPREFSESELSLLSALGDQAALAIENAHLHNLVSQQALTDPLTGLPNRRAFDQQLQEEIRRSNRYNHPFVLILIDMDGFKRVNDSFGHPAGDKTLQLAGGCFFRSVRDTDFLARLGGDEFALILPETTRENAEKIGQKLKRAIASCPFEWRIDENNPLVLSLSWGIATFPVDANDAQTLIQVADTSLYEAKKQAQR